MENDSGVAARELRVDGGATANAWMMQLQAGVVGLPVRRPALIETTALGAAGLAGLATGVWESSDYFLDSQGDPTTFSPGMTDDERRRLLAGWNRAVEAAVTWARAGEAE